jgi:flagellar biosynthesis protein
MGKNERKKAAALSYDAIKGTAPKVVAKGVGKVAENILEVAQEAHVPVYEDKKLATLLTELEIEEQIPIELYDIVAKILVFVGDVDDLYARLKKEPK